MKKPDESYRREFAEIPLPNTTDPDVKRRLELQEACINGGELSYEGTQEQLIQDLAIIIHRTNNVVLLLTDICREKGMTLDEIAQRMPGYPGKEGK